MPTNKENVKTATDAATAGNVALFKKTLKENPEVAAHPGPLCAAALHGHTEAVNLLLKAGADPNAVVPSHSAYRPLHRAIEHCGVKKNAGHVPTVKALLAGGADPELRATWMGLTALATAAHAGDEEMIALLLETKPKIDFFAAIILLDTKKVEAFLKKDAGLAKTADDNAMTSLQYLAISGRSGEKYDAAHLAIGEKLLALGANPNELCDIGPYKNIPVMHFAAKSTLGLASLLLKNGANPNHGFGNCLWREPGEMAELFLSHGADVNLREEKDQPVLHSRIHWNLPSVALWLLEKGADPNLLDAQGNTALHTAASRGINTKVVQALLDRGAKTKLRNKAGHTALDIATAKKKTDIIKLLSSR